MHGGRRRTAPPPFSFPRAMTAGQDDVVHDERAARFERVYLRRHPEYAALVREG